MHSSKALIFCITILVQIYAVETIKLKACHFLIALLSLISYSNNRLQNKIQMVTVQSDAFLECILLSMIVLLGLRMTYLPCAGYSTFVKAFMQQEQKAS